MSNHLQKTNRMHHVALNVLKFEECVQFYTDFFPMKVEWQPDKDSIYLTSRNDNLALHKTSEPFLKNGTQHLAHIGFILNSPESVDEWYKNFIEKNVVINNKPKTHRDGARSFYCFDPDGNCVRLIYHSPLSARGKW